MTNEILRMQLLSGVITESEYKAKLETLNEGIKDYPKVIKKEKYVLVRGLYPSNPNTSIKIFPSNGLTLSDFDKWETELLDIAKKGSITKKPGTSFFFSVYADENGKPTEKRVGPEGTDEPEYSFHSVSPNSLNENFVGMGMVGNIFDREKTDYEIAFEHFTKGTSLKENEETSLTSSPEYKKILSILKDNPEEVEALEKVQDKLETLTEEEYYTKEDLKKLLKNAGIGALTSTLFSALVASFPGMSAADIVQTVLAGLGIGAVAGAYAGHKADKGITETHPLEGGPGYMTKHHAGVLTRLISDLESEDTSKFSESNLENYEKTLSSLKAALEASKAKYKEETGKELEETLNENSINFIEGDETVKDQVKTYFEEMARNYPENLASVLTGLVMGDDPTFEDFVNRVLNDISGADNPFGLD